MQTNHPYDHVGRRWSKASKYFADNEESYDSSLWLPPITTCVSPVAMTSDFQEYTDEAIVISAADWWERCTH